MALVSISQTLESLICNGGHFSEDSSLHVDAESALDNPDSV